MQQVLLSGRTSRTFTGTGLPASKSFTGRRAGAQTACASQAQHCCNQVICFSWCWPKRWGGNNFHSQNNDLLEAEEKVEGKAGPFDLLFFTAWAREGSKFKTSIND